jgi:hypothetical protein
MPEYMAHSSGTYYLKFIVSCSLGQLIRSALQPSALIIISAREEILSALHEKNAVSTQLMLRTRTPVQTSVSLSSEARALFTQGMLYYGQLAL